MSNGLGDVRLVQDMVEETIAWHTLMIVAVATARLKERKAWRWRRDIEREQSTTLVILIHSNLR